MTENAQRPDENPVAELGHISRRLGTAITATTEYHTFAEADRRYQDDTQAQELYGQYQEAQRMVQLMQHLSRDTAQEAKSLEVLQAALEANRTITGYFDAQEHLVMLLRELNEFISGRLNLDFAGLTKPKAGCCG